MIVRVRVNLRVRVRVRVKVRMRARVTGGPFLQVLHSWLHPKHNFVKKKKKSDLNSKIFFIGESPPQRDTLAIDLNREKGVGCRVRVRVS